MIYLLNQTIITTWE